MQDVATQVILRWISQVVRLIKKAIVRSNRFPRYFLLKEQTQAAFIMISFCNMKFIKGLPAEHTGIHACSHPQVINRNK